MDREDHLERLKQAVCEGLEDEALELAGSAVEAGTPALEVLNGGAVAGLQEAGRLWREGEYFMPEVILSAAAFRGCVELLKPKLAGGAMGREGTFVIGTVANDMHDLGKSIVAAMLSGAGFEVVDLGVNVPTRKFVDEIARLKPDLVGIGAYMSTTMQTVRDVVAALASAGLRDSVAVMVGGVPITPQFAQQVGADGYAPDAVAAVRVAKQLMEARRG